MVFYMVLMLFFMAGGAQGGAYEGLLPLQAGSGASLQEFGQGAHGGLSYYRGPLHAHLESVYNNYVLKILKENTISFMQNSCLKWVLGMLSDYEPAAYGLDIPEPLLKEAYIMRPDLSFMVGWETGRQSEPAFMDMNLHATRGTSSPQVVLYQHDLADPMNPLGLLVAYAEQQVLPAGRPRPRKGWRLRGLKPLNYV